MELLSTPWYCDEHGEVLAADWTGSVEFSVLHFCPVCRKEIHRRDVLSQIEGPRANSPEDYVDATGWKEAA